MLKEIMDYIHDEDAGQDKFMRAIIFVILIVCTMFSSSILKENLRFKQVKIGVQAKQALTGMIYSKIFKVSSATNSLFKKGDIVSLIQVDSQKILFLFYTLPEVSRIPYLMAFFIIILYILVGITFAAVLAIVIVFCFVYYLLAKWSGKVQAYRMKTVDMKINVISEIIDNIKLIKLNSWISLFMEKINERRTKEVNAILKKNCLWMLNMTFMNMNYPILTISTFLIAIFGLKITVAMPIALAIMKIINTMHSSAKTLPLFFGDLIDLLVSLKRIQKFLNCSEREVQSICNDDTCHDQTSIRIKDCSFFWGLNEKLKKKEQIIEPDKSKFLPKSAETQDDAICGKFKTDINDETKSTESKTPDLLDHSDHKSDEDSKNKGKMSLLKKITIRNIDLTIKKGEFVAVIGETGAGKTSLISSIIGDMLAVDSTTVEKFKNYNLFDAWADEESVNNKNLVDLNGQIYEKFNLSRKKDLKSPKVFVKGSVSLMEQTPWVLNATIRDNILFGEVLDEERYNKTIELCQLARDLEILDGGDLTEIGEKGINLSGGQKARIGIARAVYANKDIVLMDDPLSALDAHVKRNIFDQVLLRMMSSKTRVLVTHAVDFLDKVDRILVIDKGEIIHNGSFEELKDLDYFKTILEHMRKEDQNDEEHVKEDTRKAENDALFIK